MATAEEWAAELAAQAGYEISRAQDLAKKTARLARDIAATEDAVAKTMDHMAATHPDDASRYEALAEHARRNAVRERRHAGITTARARQAKHDSGVS